MSIFIPNAVAQYSRMNGYSPFGEATFDAPKRIEITIIKFTVLATPTPIRSEASASRGKGDEPIAKEAKIIIPAPFVPAIDDRMLINGESFRVTGTFPRFDLFGTFAHTEVTLRVTVA